MPERIKTVSYPYEMQEKDGLTIIRFIVKDPNAKYPDTCKLRLVLNPKDKQTLAQLLTK
jgi:hypothetical protein